MADTHDIFTADILYHEKCYSPYLTRTRRKRHNQEETKILNKWKECEVCVVKKCLELFSKKVLIDRNAFFMSELIQGIHEVSLENGLQDAIIKHAHLLKKGLLKMLS